MGRSMSWKTYLTAGAGVVTGSATVLAAMTGVPTLATILGAGVACTVCAKLGRGTLHESPALDHLDPQTREQAELIFPLAPAAHAAWVAGATLVDAPPTWAAVLVALGFAEYGVARGLEYRSFVRKRNNPDPVAELPPAHDPNNSHAQLAPIADPDAPIHGMSAVLARCGLGHLRVIQWQHVGPANEVLGVKYTVKLPASVGKKNGETRLSQANAEPIAIAVSEASKTDIGSSWVQISKLPAAGTYTITITMSDTMARVYPYQLDTSRVSINDPALIGYGIDGLPVYERINQHWLHTGGTRFGKTSLVQVIRTHALRAPHEACLWVGGTEKLYDSVGPWVDPFIGTGVRPPIDWIAKGPQDTLNMITAAFMLGRWRQSVPHHRRGGFKQVIVEIDEASFFLMIEKLVTEHEGETLGPSQMAANIIKGVGSAGVWIHLVSQRGTNDQLGVEGGTINANIQVRTCFRSSDEDEIGRAFGDWKIPQPMHKGEYVYRGESGAVLRLRAPYIQENDPSKASVHNGATLKDVALALGGTWQGLDRESAWALGELYANRPQTAEELYRYLTGLDPDLEFEPSVTNPATGHPGTAPTPPTSSAEPGLSPVPDSPEQGTGNPLTVDAHAVDDALTPPLGVPIPGTGNPPVPEQRPPSVPEREPEPATTGNSVPSSVAAEFPEPVPAGAAVPSAVPSGIPGGMPMAGMVGRATATPDVEQMWKERGLALITRLTETGDTENLQRLASLTSIDEVEAFERQLNGEEAPVKAMPAVATPAQGVFTPSTAPSTTPSTAARPPAMPMATLVEDKPSLDEAIASLVKQSSDQGMTRAEIITALVDQGNASGARSFEQQVSNALRRLIKQEDLVRIEGRYWATEHAPTTT